MKQWQLISERIQQATGRAFFVADQQNVAGGSINAAFLLSGKDGQQYFVKTNQTGQQAMFAAEAQGLQEISSSETITVPESICYGDDGVQSYHVLEYLDMAGQANQKILGEQLAAMHRVTAKQFGWEIHNTIGDTPQQNDWMESWVDFWREQRLGFQLKLAAKNGYGGELQTLGEKVLLEMPKLFPEHFNARKIKASMLHGDLWGGNVAGLKDGTPVIFDPAFYYGDREADLAMTYVFGGFDADFYASYQNAFPLDDGFAVRKNFYNIYHIINHLNMFGGGYHGQAVNMLKQVLGNI